MPLLDRSQRETVAEGGSARGRPRDAGRDVAILNAALELLVATGYDALSIEAVAQRAGVGKATIYRRYAGKAAMVAAAVDQRSSDTPAAVGSGDLRQTLLEVLQWLADSIAEQEIGLLGALFAGMRSDPDLAAAMRRILRRDEAAMVTPPLQAALEHGDGLAPHAAELFVEIGPAVIVHRLVVVGEPCDRAFLEHIVDDVLVPLMRHR